MRKEKLFAALPILPILFMTMFGNVAVSNIGAQNVCYADEKTDVGIEPLFSNVDGYVNQYLNDGTEYSVFLAYPKRSNGWNHIYQPDDSWN